MTPNVPSLAEDQFIRGSGRGLGILGSTLQTTSFKKILLDQVGEFLSHVTLTLFSKPAFQDPENTIFFFGKSVNRIKDLGEELKTCSGPLSLWFDIFSPGFHINEGLPGHQQHRLEDHIVIRSLMPGKSY